jgi:hypothetical protein
MLCHGQRAVMPDSYVNTSALAEAVVLASANFRVIWEYGQEDAPQRDASAIYSSRALAFQLRQLVDQWLGGSDTIVHWLPQSSKHGPVVCGTAIIC